MELTNTMETSPSWKANISLGSRKGGKCREGGKNETLWEKFIWLVKREYNMCGKQG